MLAQTAPDLFAEVLFRTGTFLLLTAWIVGSLWLFTVRASTVRSSWKKWQTWPFPEKRAIVHVLEILVLIGAWTLFLWFAVVWFTL